MRPLNSTFQLLLKTVIIFYNNSVLGVEKLTQLYSTYSTLFKGMGFTGYGGRKYVKQIQARGISEQIMT
jgi:hypothetical protein